MSIFSKEVSNGFILLETDSGFKVLSLRDWNLNYKNAEILFSAKTKAEALAFESWAMEVI